ncbi:MAG TPA: prenyltransferase/squalene oxidase repeat-containing protein, partial [Pirellulales bacterium]|nr:prenyltransferase/squalene oxidase repeat-containing protein [Pirellulales bacterium]
MQSTRFAGEHSVTAGAARERFWLNGEVVFCACPDCRAPMSIRMWLQLADCLHCGTSIEINDEDLQEIERLKADRAKATEPADPPPPPEPPPPEIEPQKSAPPGPTVESTFSRRRVAANQPIGVRRKIRKMATVGTVQVWWQDFFRDWPAWMVSGILHLAALLILSMLASGLVFLEEDPFITLSTVVDRPIREGGHALSLPTDEVQFDLPITPSELPATKEARLRLAQDARDLRLDPDAPLPNAPSTQSVKEAIRSDDPDRRALAVRDPRVRAEIVRQEGGTTMTEAAVARGLRWMALHQNSNGSWSLNQFNSAGECGGRCSGHSGLQSDPGGTALALLPFLGGGQTHLVGKYQPEVSAGLKYLLSIQKKDGDLRGNSGGNAGMYAHGQAAIVLCEAYKMSGDELLRDPAQRAIDFLVEAQYLSGGWRYRTAQENPGDTPDTSVLGWQVTALHSAKGAYLDVPESAMQLAAFYLDKAQATHAVREQTDQIVYGRDGGLYAYQPGQPFKRTMTAEGLLCRMFMGWRLDHPGIQEGIGFIVNHQLPDISQRDLYYWYYGT